VQPNSNNLVSFDTFLLKEIWASKNERFSANFGFSLKNFGATIGYNPDILNRTFEVHFGVFEGWTDALKLNLAPKIGIGVTVKF